MRRTLMAGLALLLFLPALRALHDPPDKPSTPAEEYQALVKEFQQQQQDYVKAMSAARTAEDRRKAQQEKAPKIDQFTPKFLELARKHVKDPAAQDALVWIVQYGSSTKEASEAVDLLLKDFVESPRMTGVCQTLMNSVAPASEKLLRGILEKNPNHDAQGVACYSLAVRLERQAATAERARQTAQAEQYHKQADELFERVGKDFVDVAAVQRQIVQPGSAAPVKLMRAVVEKSPSREAKAQGYYSLALRLRQQANQAANKNDKTAAEKLGKEADEAVEQVARDYGDLEASQRQLLAPNSVATVKALRVVLEKTMTPEMKAQGTYALGLRLKGDAEKAAGNDQLDEVEKLYKQAEVVLERVEKEFADVPFQRRKLGDLAKDQLFEIRHLAVGREAPVVEGEDLDGKNLKLSDYRGKVVLLDFWGNW